MNTKLLALLPLTISTAVAQQADSESPLDTVVVTGNRAPSQISEIAASMSVVDERRLQDQLAADTNVLSSLDTLVPGLTVSQGEFRNGCRTNIRGRAAQFLINGVPTNDNLRRSTCGSLFGLSPHAIERIEVVRGSTALYGAGAPGGLINLITRSAGSNEPVVDLVTQWSFNPHERDDSDEYNFYAGAGQKLDSVDYYAGIAYSEYGVRRDPNGTIVPGTTFEDVSVHTTLGTGIGGGELRLTALYFEQDPEDVYSTDGTQLSGSRFAENVFVPEPRNPFEAQAETTQTVLSLGYTHPDVLGHALEVSIYYHDEELVQRSADYFEGDVFYFDSNAQNERLGLRSALHRTVETSGGELEFVYGFDALRQSYYRPQVDPATGAIIGYVSPEVVLDQYAVFVQPRWQMGRWQFTGGIRHERFYGEIGDRGYDPTLPRVATPGDTPDFHLSLFNIGAIYNLTETLQLYGGFSQGAEISEFGRAARGAADPDLVNLDADASDQYELGLRGTAGPVAFSAAVFYSQSDKAADLQADPSCAGEPLCPLIPLRLERELQGIELTADWRASERVTVGSLLTYQEGEAKEPGAPAIPFGTDTLSPLRLTAYAELEVFSGWQNRLQVSYFHESDEYDAAEQALGYRNTDSYTLVDLVSSYSVGPGRLTLGISNLLNEEYVNVTNQASGDFFYYLSEGRRATLGYNMRF
jgi:iron complex outermembrane receptor protein